jgi:hypothetical protein
MFILITLIMIATYLTALGPYWNRLANTSLWIGRALTDPEFETTGGSLALPKITQAALMEGFPSNMYLITAFSPYVSGALSGVIGFLYSWWVAVFIFLGSPLVSILIARKSSRDIEHFIMYLMHRIANRTANYKVKGDKNRIEAGESIYNDLSKLLSIYANSGVKAPSAKLAGSAPCGDPSYLLRL